MAECVCIVRCCCRLRLTSPCLVFAKAWPRCVGNELSLSVKLASQHRIMLHRNKRTIWFSMVQMFMHRRCSWTHVLFCFCIRVLHFLRGIGVDACMCMHELISEWYCLQYLRRVHGVVSMCLVQLWWVIRLAPINQERAALEYAPSHTGEMFPCYAGAAFRPAFQTSLTRRLTQSVEPAWWNKEKERISIAAVASLLT